ncbi:MAG: fumarylacetoacetate hydrolase family protein [Halanaerobiaceae bacterium]
MKLVRYVYQDKVNYGKLENQVITKIKGSIFDENIQFSFETIPLNNVELINPIQPPNVIAIGLNYLKHAKETGSQLPDNPLIFIKATTAVTGPKEDIILPANAPNEVDFEAELAVIIGKKAKNISATEIGKYILGYTCANDVSARDCQKRIDKQWARGKSFDTFCPLGPWIETELNADQCNIRSILNGEIMQNSNTSDLIFSINELLSYISSNMTLLPGTVILTGTPEGVGFARNPQVFLREGDKIEIEIEGIGVLSNKVVKEE